MHDSCDPLAPPRAHRALSQFWTVDVTLWQVGRDSLLVVVLCSGGGGNGQRFAVNSFTDTGFSEINYSQGYMCLAQSQTRSLCLFPVRQVMRSQSQTLRNRGELRPTDDTLTSEAVLEDVPYGGHERATSGKEYSVDL